MVKNNLFYYATSELSQDAFICYLASFAFKDASVDTVLNECARNLFHLFVPEIDAEDVVLEKIEQQFNLGKNGRVDVLFTAQSKGKNYKIIIEDKKFTGDYTGQLINYKDGILSIYPEYEVRGVFYKTGFQSNLSAAEEANYTIVTREKILEFLAPYIKKINNQIIIDYYYYWKEFQEETLSFKNTSIQNWTWKQVYGFYDYLKNSDFTKNNALWMEYNYVANPTGGFYGLWFGPSTSDVNIDGIWFEFYLQLETVTAEEKTDVKICLKLCHKDDHKLENVRNARKKIIYADNWEYRAKRYRFRKPKRVAGAKHMTIGIFDMEYTNTEELLLAIQEALNEYNKMHSSLKSGAESEK